MKTISFTKYVAALAAIVGLMFQATIAGAADDKTEKNSIDISKVRVPEIYGTIKEVHKGNDNVIFYLQDAHCNVEAQQNNSRIVQDLMAQFGVDTVCVEGFAGPSKTKELAAFPDKQSMADVATYFMNEGRISGIEHLAITGDRPFTLIGLEDESLYNQNRESLRECAAFQKTAAGEIRELEKCLNQIADKTYSDDLKALCAKVADYRAGKIKFTEFAQAMRDAAAKHGVDISASANFALQGKSFEMEGKINFDAVEDERAAVVDEVSKKLSKEDASSLVVQSLSFRLGRLNAAEYYDILKGHCDKSGVDLKSKANLAQYIDYIKVFDQINKDALVDEANAVEAAIKDKLFTSDAQRKLDKMGRQLDMIARMFDVKLGIRDYKVFVKSAPEHTVAAIVKFIQDTAPGYGIAVPSIGVPALEKEVAAIEKFYSIAVQRDDVLAKNAVAWLKDNKLDKMILVTGGFHTSAITDQLVKAGFSVVVITPRITDFNVKSPYMDVIMGAPTPLEKAFRGEAVGSQTLTGGSANDQNVRGAMTRMATRLQGMRTALPATAPDTDKNAKMAQIQSDMSAGLPAGVAVEVTSPVTGVYIATYKDAAGVAKRAMVLNDSGTALPAAVAGGTVVPSTLAQEVRVIDLDQPTAAAIAALPKIPSALTAKVIGATITDVAQIAAVEAAIRAGTVVPTPGIPGLPTVDPRIEFRRVADPTIDVPVDPSNPTAGTRLFDVLTGDGKAFEFVTTKAHANIVLDGGRAIIGVPAALLDSMDAMDRDTLKLALLKDIAKATGLLNNGYVVGDTSPINLAKLRAENLRGLQAQGTDAMTLSDLGYYFNKGQPGIEELLRMASDAKTSEKIAEIEAVTKNTTDRTDNWYLTADESTRAIALARKVKDAIEFNLLQNYLLGIKSAEIEAALGVVANVAIGEAINQVKNQLPDVIRRDAPMTPQDLNSSATKFVLAQGILDKNGADKGAINPLLKAVLGADHNFLGYAFRSSSTSVASAQAQVAQAMKELMYLSDLAKADRAVTTQMLEDIAAGRYPDIKEFAANVRCLVDYDVVNGIATNFRAKTPNAQKIIEALLLKKINVTLYSNDLDENGIRDLLIRAFGMDVPSYEGTHNFHMVQAGPKLADVPTRRDRTSVIVAHASDALTAPEIVAMRGQGCKIAVGDGQNSFDRLLTLAMSDAARAAEILDAAGVSGDEKAAMLAAVRNGEILPPSEQTASPLANLYNNPRSFEVSA